MLYEVLQRWQNASTDVNLSSVGIVFHTSCVNYGVADLQNLYRIAPVWFLPDDVYRELGLLLRSPKLCEAAQFLLDRASRINGWDMERFYAHSMESERQRPRTGMLLFLFGDLNKQDEFLRLVRAEKDMYILLCKEWSPKRCMEKTFPGVYPLSVCTPVRRVEPLSEAVPCKPPHRLAYLSSEPDGGGMRIPGSEFEMKREMFGSYAYIYSCAQFPEMLIKGYQNGAASGSRLRKLQMLQSIGQTPLYGRLPLALPRHLLYHEQICAAFTMNVCHGTKLVDMLNGNDPRMSDPDVLEIIFERLFLLILELHTKHILINDLSFNDVMIDSENRVSLVDCDSFQVFWIPGGPITDYYRHPEVKKNQADVFLHEPMHEYFALAVLLYQCILRSDNPLIRVNGEDNPDWENAVFPLETDGFAHDSNGREMRVNERRYQYWMEQPRVLRQAFADVFHFRRILSVGTWMRILNIGNPSGTERSRFL